MLKKKISPRCLIQGFFLFSYFLVAVCFLIPAVTVAYGVLTQGYLASSTVTAIVDHTAQCGIPCKNVSVSGTDSRTYFVPTKECREWEKFRQNKPGSVSVNNCVIPPSDPCIVDFDYMGDTYYGQYIGDQCWLVDNLNVGTTTGTYADDGVIQKKCYNNNTSNCNTYGALYTPGEATAYSTSTAQGICPSGWHLPTWAEIEDLYDYIGISSATNTAAALNIINGVNSSFNFQLSGRSNPNSTYSYLDQQGYILSSTIDPDPVNGGPLALWLADDPTYTWSSSSLYTVNSTYGYSVRCIKDSEFVQGGMPIN